MGDLAGSAAKSKFRMGMCAKIARGLQMGMCAKIERGDSAGPLRLERDSLLAHGASFILQERLLHGRPCVVDQIGMFSPDR